MNHVEQLHSHQEIGQKQSLFFFHEQAPGMPFYMPKGLQLKNALLNEWRAFHAGHYEEIQTPLLMKEEMWKQSGHYAHYAENMYFAAGEKGDYALKPMNCPGAVLAYQHRKRSYKELPVRFAELGLVHRREQSGSLNGLLRVSAFTQDDAHLFVREDQIKAEVEDVLSLMMKVYAKYGFSYAVELSTRPESRLGSDEHWDAAESALQQALSGAGIDYAVNAGDGAFYGPKIDFHLQDSRGRSWQCGTVQLDFQMPGAFGCTYVDEKGDLAQPVMIHRAIFGSVERFIGILLEHVDGRLPKWLAPVQAVVMPVAEKHRTYSEFIVQQLERAGLRVEHDDNDDRIGAKIRRASMQHIPYQLVIGDREEQSGILSIRNRDGETQEWELNEWLAQLPVSG